MLKLHFDGMTTVVPGLNIRGNEKEKRTKNKRG
jgi:hypothetical protein